jgi:transposase
MPSKCAGAPVTPARDVWLDGMEARAGASPHVNVGCRAGLALSRVEPQMWEAPVQRNRTSVGLDVHARSVLACGLDGQTGELFERRLYPDHGEIISWAQRLPGPAAVAYETSPTGFGPARFLTRQGIDCQVTAPSKPQHPTGDRIKTDVRDARHLTRLHLGEIVAVTVPSVEQEAARDLVHARNDVRGDLMAARHRCVETAAALLLHCCCARGSSTPAAHRGPARMTDGCAPNRVTRCSTRPGSGAAFDVAYDTLLATTTHRDRLDTAMTGSTPRSPRWPRPASSPRPWCGWGRLRGVTTLTATLTAFGLAVEIDDWHRLTSRSIRAYLGLMPSESSSGNSRSPGPITKTGNGHTRRLLVEAAWHHHPPNRIGAQLRRRQDAASPAARDRGQHANRRLHDRRVHFNLRRKRAVVANTATAPTPPPPATRPAGAGHWPSTTTNHHDQPRRPTSDEPPPAQPSAGDHLASLVRVNIVRPRCAAGTSDNPAAPRHVDTSQAT